MIELGAIEPFLLRLRHRVLRALQRPALDLPLLGALLLLAAIGLTTLYSASNLDRHLVFNQGARFVLGGALMLLIARVPPLTLRNWTPWLYVGSVLLLVAVALLGEGRGAHRWLDLGVVRFQPSELLKLTMPMMVAWYLNGRPLPPGWITLAAVGLLIVIPVGLIAEQPDLGTALLVAAAGGMVILLAGLQLRYILSVVGLLIPVAYGAWAFLLHDYQRQRILTFLDPQSDPLGSGYHIIQSQIAIGSGGVFGKGYLNGSQAQLEFLPERSTDFIFAVVGEEWGLIGLVTVICLFMFVIGRALYLSATAQDTFARLASGSLALTFCVYVFVNTGMVTGLMPVVGVPLPFISYGGTAMVTLMAGFGILMSLCAKRKLVSR